MKTTIFTFLFSLIIVQLSFSQTDPRLEGIEEELAKVLDSFYVAGFSVAVVEKDSIIYSKGFGYSNYEEKTKADDETLFAIGSCTKAFTTAILGQIRQKGEIDFSESPRKYLPELEFYNDNLNNNVIITDLIAHRTGIPRHDFSWYLFPTESRQELLERIKYQENFTGIREQWYYNNFMYFLQGQIAEKITGKSWEENIQTRFFGPLEMQRSQVDMEGVYKMENVSLPYTLSSDQKIEKTDYYAITSLAAAGSIYSSAKEMGNWLRCWINNGKFNGQQIIPESYRNEAMSSHMVVGSGLPSNENPDLHFSTYGYGWFLNSYRGHYRVQHGGNIDGFSANTAFYPTDSIGIVVLVNQDGSAANGAIRNIIIDRLLELEPIDWIGNIKKELDEARQSAKEVMAGSGKAKIEGTSPTLQLPEYTGKYHNEAYGEFEVRLSNDSLFAVFPDEKAHLEHYHYDIFKPFFYDNGELDTTDIGLMMQFYLNAKGEIDRVESQIEPTLDPIAFDKQIMEVELDQKAISIYEGQYELAGVTVKFYSKDDNKLYLTVPGQPEYELISMGEDKFALKGLDGFEVVFGDLEEDVFQSVTFDQPNGVFKATRVK